MFLLDWKFDINIWQILGSKLCQSYIQIPNLSLTNFITLGNFHSESYFQFPHLGKEKITYFHITMWELCITINTFAKGFIIVSQLKSLILNLNIYQKRYSAKGITQDLMAQLITHIYIQFVTFSFTFSYIELIHFLRHSQ